MSVLTSPAPSVTATAPERRLTQMPLPIRSASTRVFTRPPDVGLGLPERVVGLPDQRLRAALPSGYTAFVQQTDPHRVLVPATTAVPVVIKLQDSVRRPPQFAMGAHATAAELSGPCAPSYLQLWLAPLAAYAVLGLPIHRLGTDTVDLGEILGRPARQLGARLREEPRWDRRFVLLDEFLLERLSRGPRPSPEVQGAWRRLVVSAGAAPIGEIVRDVGWSHRHLIAKFKEQIGLFFKTVAALVRFERLIRHLDSQQPIQ
jgi:hypothetical protein